MLTDHLGLAFQSLYRDIIPQSAADFDDIANDTNENELLAKWHYPDKVKTLQCRELVVCSLPGGEQDHEGC